MALWGWQAKTLVITLDRAEQDFPTVVLDANTGESPARESGALDLGWNGDDYTERLVLAAVSAATVTSAASVSTAGMSATMRTAEASTRRESARLSAAAAAETTSARRA